MDDLRLCGLAGAGNVSNDEFKLRIQGKACPPWESAHAGGATRGSWATSVTTRSFTQMHRLMIVSMERLTAAAVKL